MDIQATLDEIINDALSRLSGSQPDPRPTQTVARIHVQLIEKLTPLFKETVRPADFTASTAHLNALIRDLQKMQLSSSDESARMPYEEAKDIAWGLLRGYDREAREIVAISWQAKGRMVVSYKTGLRVRGTLTYVHNQGSI